MLLDATLNFVAPGSPLSLVGGAGVSIPSTGIIDLLGLGVGVAPSERIIGLPQSGVFGEDAGIGGVKPQVQVNIGTALAAVGGSTLNVAFQGAPDQGAAGNYQPGTWQTFVETGPMTAAQLAANAVCARFDFPPAFPPGARPRYLRLLFSPSTGGSFSAGTVSSAIVTMVRDDYAIKYAPANFAVGATS
jgi:hypothetical protein